MTKKKTPKEIKKQMAKLEYSLRLLEIELEEVGGTVEPKTIGFRAD